MQENDPVQMKDLLKQAFQTMLDNLGLSEMHILGEHEIPAEMFDTKLLGTMSFIGPKIKGVVAAQGSESFLLASHPLGISELSLDEERKWLLELINFTVGSIKSQLAQYGVKMEMGIPTTIDSQSSFPTSASLKNPMMSFNFYSKENNLAFRVFFLASITDKIQLKRDPSAIVGDMGTMIEF